MLKASIFSVVGFMIGAGTVETIHWTRSAAQIKPATTVGVPSIDELHFTSRLTHRVYLIKPSKNPFDDGAHWIKRRTQRGLVTPRSRVR